jgi:hypothetical protein
MRRHDKITISRNKTKNDVLVCVRDIESELFSCMNGITIEVYNHHIVIIEIWIRLNNTLPPRNKDVLNPLQFASAYKT